MSGSVIVAGARTPIGRLLGALKDFSAADLGGVAIKAALERAGVTGDQVDYVIMGQVIQAGAGQIPARQAAVAGGIPMTRALDHDQQGLPVRPRRDRAGRPADPRRRVRDRRGRRHGVDDPGAAPAAEVPRGLSSTATRRWSTRWPTTGSTDSLRPGRDGRAAPRTATPRTAADPRGAGRVRRAVATSGPPRRRKNGLFDDEIVPVEIPQRKGDPIVVSARTRASARDTTAESLGQAAAGVRQGRHDHRRLRLADLRRRLRRRRDEQGQGRGARPRPGSPRSARTASSPAPTPRLQTQPANAIAKALRAGGHRRRRPRPGRDQRGVRRGRHRVDPRARHRPTTRSTSTAARSRSATRSACPAPGSCCTSPSSSSAAAAASVRPRCAAAAARATP